MSTTNTPSFDSMDLLPSVIKAVENLGYEQPSPIQAAAIPPLLEGNDLLGQAQTGTGKTAAFALPLLTHLDQDSKHTQVLVLTPTRELAIQVAEAFQTYAQGMKKFHVLPIYGGQAYGIQLKHLRQGAQIVVGTPGRVMDHIRKGTLKLDQLSALVLDEADEMLRMGFIDDVKWILSHTPDTRQTALFSATMPSVIRKVAQAYLNNPVEIKIAGKTSTATTIRQQYWQVSGYHKLDALTRIIEVEEFDAMLVFVRTKNATTEVAEKLQARGYNCAALNGDMTQSLREATIEKLKKGRLDILVATDVAARGLDVKRISHVINFDIPYDAEAYTHRIGRTGRAGRSGDAILFITPREQRLLKSIERATKQPIEAFKMPSTDEINQQRITKFKDKLNTIIASQDLEFFTTLVSDYQHEQGVDSLQIAAAAALLAQGDEPLLLPEPSKRADQSKKQNDQSKRERNPDKPSYRNREQNKQPSLLAIALKEFPDIPMARYRVEVGYNDEVRPGSIVGAIANEADIDSCYIGQIDIFDDFTTVDLPSEMPREIMKIVSNARVCGKRLNIKLMTDKQVSKNSYPKTKPSIRKKSGSPTSVKANNNKKRKVTSKTKITKNKSASSVKKQEASQL